MTESQAFPPLNSKFGIKITHVKCQACGHDEPTISPWHYPETCSKCESGLSSVAEIWSDIVANGVTVDV